MENKNKCNICKIRACIMCEECVNPTYFCSRGHLHSHKIKSHKTIKNPKNGKNENQIVDEYDLRKLFEHLQGIKKEIENKLNEQNFVEAILLINKALVLSKYFYKEDNIYVIFKI